MDVVTELRGWRHRRRLGIPCRDAVERMTDHLEGALAGRERRRFERHLRHCPPCARLLERLRTTVATIARIDPDADERVDPDVRATLVARYRAARREA